MITGTQIKVARRLLNWAPDRLARRARVAVTLILQSEQQDGRPLMSLPVARTLQHIFENEGLEFPDDPAVPVRWRAGRMV